MQRILTTRQRVVKIFVLLKSNALFNAFLREEGGTRMRDGRSLRHFEVFAFDNLTRLFTSALPMSRGLPHPLCGSSLPEGAFHKAHPASTPYLLLLTG